MLTLMESQMNLKQCLTCRQQGSQSWIRGSETNPDEQTTLKANHNGATRGVDFF